MPALDFWKDQAVLTNVVNRPLLTDQEREATLGASIMPLLPVQSRAVKVQVAQTYSFGLGQFKAPDATPPIAPKVAYEWSEKIIELALLEEMERITGEHWLRLISTDAEIKKTAGVDLVTRLQILQQRNDRLTEWMRWQALVNGTLTIEYDDAQTALQIDYGRPAGHAPVAGIAWTDTVNSDPISDIKAWQQQVADSSGTYGLNVHMASETWELMLRNQKVKAYLTGNDRSLLIPTRDDVMALLRDGTTIIVTDAGYRPEGTVARGRANHTRYLPQNKVLVTTDYTVDGERIADMPDGQVIVSDAYNSLVARQGPQSEVIINHLSKAQFYRQASARIPRILHPECILCAQVSA
jgi:hypothetical protein